jgi:hypothetical protein
MGTSYVDKLSFDATSGWPPKELGSLHHVGTLPGVIVDFVSAVVGPGASLLEFDGIDQLRWTAPGASDAGDWVTISGATAVLYAAEYAGFVRVSIESGFLPPGPAAAKLYLADEYSTDTTPGDVEADDAESGTVRYYEFGVTNLGESTVDVKLWLGGTSPGTFEVSPDYGGNWYTPTSFETALSLGELPMGSGFMPPPMFRETIAASTAADPAVRLEVHVAFKVSGETEWDVATARGLYRVWNDPEYRFYRSNSAPPEEDDEPYATAATLPATPDDTFSDGTWYLSCSYFNGVLDSGFLPVGPRGETYRRIVIASGEATDEPPALVQQWRLELRAGGVVRIAGFYLETGAGRAHQWAIGYTTNGADPTPDDPQVTVDFVGSAGVEILTYDLPAQADETTVKVLLQTRRNDGTTETPVWVYSEDDTILTVSADATGPSAPVAAGSWPGHPTIPEV